MTVQTVDVLSPAGEKSGTVALPAEIFDVRVNVPLIHQVVVAQLAAARQGTHDTKTRGEVRGGGRKPFRQKGTGRARQGSTRAPQFVGGGVVHGPTPRSYVQRTPKKMKVAALRGALSDRAREGRIHVLTGLVDGAVPSARTAVAALARISQRPHVLVVLDRADVVTQRSLRNASHVHLLVPDQLNTYDVLVSDDVVFTEAALDAFLALQAQGALPVGAAPAPRSAPAASLGDVAGMRAAAVRASGSEAPTGAASPEPRVSGDGSTETVSSVGATSTVHETDLGDTDPVDTDLVDTDLVDTDLGDTDLGDTDLGDTDLGGGAGSVNSEEDAR